MKTYQPTPNVHLTVMTSDEADGADGFIEFHDYDCIFIRGLPGSGKSTLAKKLCDSSPTYKHFETDNYWIRPDGLYDFNYRHLSQAHAWNLEQFGASNGYTNIVSNTFVKLRTMKPYIESLIDSFEIADCLVIECTGEYGSVHGVPEEVMTNMRAAYETGDSYAKIDWLN